MMPSTLNYHRFLALLLITCLCPGTMQLAAEETPVEIIETEISTRLDNTLLDDGHHDDLYDIKHDRPDTHAPGQLMGDHVHERANT